LWHERQNTIPVKSTSANSRLCNNVPKNGTQLPFAKYSMFNQGD
jgi:hypothetical protein